MSCAEQLPRTRSLSIVKSGAQVTTRQGNQGIGQIQTSRKTIPVMVTWLTLQTLGRFTGDVACAMVDALSAALSWLISEFMTGCAAYGEAMYPTLKDFHHGNGAADQAAPTPVAARPRLVVVSDTTQAARADDLPRPVAATGRAASAERSSREEVEIVCSAGVPVARRKNRLR